jgi:hypothetical protein
MSDATLWMLNERRVQEKVIAERAGCFDVERVTMKAC